MRLAPPDLDPAQLAEALRDGWGVHVDALEYVAIGGGSHHWRAVAPDGGRLWLSVDDLRDKPFLGSTPATVLAELQRALLLARALQDEAHLEFVVAPLPTRGGEVLRPVSLRYALAVYPFLEGRTFAFGQALPAAQGQQLLEMLARLHSATSLLGGMARRVRLEVDHRDILEHALREVRQLSAPAREHLAKHAQAVQQVILDFDRLCLEVLARGAPLVITHGEPHPGNVLAPDGRLVLLDWDTAGLAPPERDLWWLAPSPYGRGQVDPAALRLYRLRWLLDDLVYCVRTLSAPHTVTIETEHALAGLVKSVELAERLAAQEG